MPRKINEKALFVSVVLLIASIAFGIKAYLFTLEAERIAFVIISIALLRFLHSLF